VMVWSAAMASSNSAGAFPWSRCQRIRLNASRTARWVARLQSL
jgi:hypothetical protein